MAVMRIVIQLLVLVYAAQAQESFELSDFLPEDQQSYDKMTPPKKDGQATLVKLRLVVLGLSSIDENTMSYVVDAFLSQIWLDSRLRFPENGTSRARLLDVDWLKHMWKPDVFFKNAKDVALQTVNTPSHVLRLNRNHTLIYMVKLTLKLSCDMNFLLYPHDTQECELQMQSFAHPTEDMIFRWSPVKPLIVHRDIELPQFKLMAKHTADCTRAYYHGNYTCVKAIFVLKRNLGYYMFHIYIPTCLIVIMSWISFWIKPELAPARVTLGVTAVLTLSTHHGKSQAALPPVSYLMAFDIFMGICTILVFMAVLEYCVVHIILGHYETPTANPPPSPPSSPSALSCRPNSTARDEIVDITTKKNAIGIMDRSQKSATASPLEPTPAERARARALKIDKASRVIFPLIFVVVNIAYWVIVTVYVQPSSF